VSFFLKSRCRHHVKVEYHIVYHIFSVYVYVKKCVCVYRIFFAYMYVCRYTYTYTYICTYIYTCTHRTHTHIFKHTYIKRTYIYLRANTKDTEAYDKIYRGDRAITGNVIQQILRGNSYVAVTGNMIEQVHRGNIRASQSQEM